MLKLIIVNMKKAQQGKNIPLWDLRLLSEKWQRQNQDLETGLEDPFLTPTH